VKPSTHKLLIAIFASLLAMAIDGLPAQAHSSSNVANQNSNNVSVIDTAASTVAAIVPAGTDPNAVAITPSRVKGESK
jgi:YVTN family beta-propeller protein